MVELLDSDRAVAIAYRRPDTGE